MFSRTTMCYWISGIYAPIPQCVRYYHCATGCVAIQWQMFTEYVYIFLGCTNKKFINAFFSLSLSAALGLIVRWTHALLQCKWLIYGHIWTKCKWKIINWNGMSSSDKQNAFFRLKITARTERQWTRGEKSRYRMHTYIYL